jgi:hypothetical protein
MVFTVNIGVTLQRLALENLEEDQRIRKNQRATAPLAARVPRFATIPGVPWHLLEAILRTLLIDNARCIATFDHVNPALARELRDASIFIQGHRILAMGPAAELPQIADEVIDARRGASAGPQGHRPSDGGHVRRSGVV